MTIIETPWLLIKWNENHYLEKFKEIFELDNKIILPEKTTKPVMVYTDKEAPIYHIWRWWEYAWLDKINFNFNEAKFYRRAQRILWIKYLLENPNLRNIYKDKRNWYICFASTELEYTVVIRELKTSFVLITAFHSFDPYSYMTNEKKFERIYSI